MLQTCQGTALKLDCIQLSNKYCLAHATGSADEKLEEDADQDGEDTDLYEAKEP